MSPPGSETMLAVDGGNSKTELVVLTVEGAVRAFVRGPTISHQQVPLDVAMDRLSDLAAQASRAAGATGPGVIGAFCLAGADFSSDVRSLERGIGRLGLAHRVVVRNDGYAPLRAGASSGWGIAVICGAGVNAVGVGPDGGRARLAGIGDLSGDWGGGYGLGMAALGASVRASDGRGPRTSLASLVPAHFGLRRPIDVARAVYESRIGSRRLEELAAVAFAAAGAGDAVARSLTQRLADELGLMATAIARRLRVVRRDVEVVLAGGVFRTAEAGFHESVDAAVRRGIPNARIVRLRAPAVLGAALIALDEAGAQAGGHAERRLRRELRAH